MKNSIILSMSLLCLSAGLKAQTTTKWTNPECETGDCEVKSFTLTARKYQDKKLIGQSMVAGIETSKPEFLKKYAVVQFIKGCMYLKNQKGDVKFAYRQSLNRPATPFLHKNFEVDSGYDSDPVYGSSVQSGWDDLRGFEVPRNAHYLNQDPGKFEQARAWGGKDSNLLSNNIYIDDMPTPTSWQIKDGILIATVSSLQFKACLYEVSKLPLRVSSEDQQLSEPITCLEWSSNFDYDFKKRAFVELKEISPVCK